MREKKAVLAVAVLAAAMVAGACAPKPGASSAAAPALKGGAEIWSENCARCHNSQSPSIYSDAEWDTVALHMRTRANLTAREHRAILAFLKSAN